MRQVPLATFACRVVAAIVPSASARRLVWLIPFTLAACDSSGGPGIRSCVPGQSNACVCPDGRPGAQTCTAQANFDGCRCDPLMGDGGERDGGAPWDGGSPSDGGLPSADGSVVHPDAACIPDTDEELCKTVNAKCGRSSDKIAAERQEPSLPAEVARIR
jgi:hypothetical protein